MKRNSTILIVDDKLSAREVLKGLLTGQGYNLAFAGNGEEALVEAAALTPDVILLDVMMPDMDGFEVCRRLRVDPLLAQVPVIMVTALDDHDSILQGIEAGADDFITKPFNHAELKARVQTITRLNRYRRLLSEQTKFEWVVEKADDGYLVVDDNDRIRYANAQARLYLGLPIEKSISDTFLELARQQYHCQPEQAWTTWPEQSPFIEDCEGCRSPRYLVRPETSTAKAFWLRVDILELPASPAGDKVIHLCDVTAQMDMWCGMWEFQTLISHKLRTPLGGVVTGLELLVEEYGITKLLDAEEAKLFEIVCQSAQRLERDIMGVLDYVATPTLGQSGIGFNLSGLQPIVAQICVDLELEAVTVSGQMKLKGDRVSLSEQAIELILREVLGNSKKFHPQQAPTIEILVSAWDDKQVSIQIRDDGLTLSPEQLAQVWLPYYQGDKHFTGEVAGMGLGLSKVAMLVWSAGGACRINNRETGPGVVVELVLPLDKDVPGQLR
jgi:two-component system cell cycle response regulator